MVGLSEQAPPQLRALYRRILERYIARDRNLEYSPAAGAQDAMELHHRVLVAGHVLEDVAAIDAVEAARAERHAREVRLHHRVVGDQVDRDVCRRSAPTQQPCHGRLGRDMQDTTGVVEQIVTLAEKECRQPMSFQRAAHRAARFGSWRYAVGTEPADMAVAARAEPARSEVGGARRPFFQWPSEPLGNDGLDGSP